MFRSLIAALVAFTAISCATSEITAMTSPAFDGPPPALDEIECDDLLTDDEVAEVMAGPFTPLGRSASSCYWTGGSRIVQLVIQTGESVAVWRDTLLGSYTERVSESGLDMWADPASESVAVFAPERGLVVHGVDRERAIRLLRLALPRLTH